MSYDTALEEFIRGDSFAYKFTLTSGWLGAHFSEVIFTLRKKKPKTSVTDDTDANVLAQAKSSLGEITFDPGDDTLGTVEFPESVTTQWDAGSSGKTYFWDLQGTIAGSPQKVHTIDTGTLLVSPDITRGT